MFAAIIVDVFSCVSYYAWEQLPQPSGNTRELLVSQNHLPTEEGKTIKYFLLWTYATSLIIKPKMARAKCHSDKCTSNIYFI